MIQNVSERILSDEVLILLRSRDAEFLKAVFKEVNPYLVRICLANGIFGDDVMELVHQAWEKFFINLDQFKGQSQIRTFICGILFNKIREFRRFQKRMVPEEDMQKVMDDAFTTDGWWKVAPVDPYKMLERQQTTEFVKECLDGLTEQQMSAFVMREVEEEESEDICHKMGVTGANLRVLLFRAKDKLRKCLEGKWASQ